MQIQTVAGYTVWKSLMFLIIVGAVWGLLTATRLLARRGGRRALGAAPRGSDHAAGRRGPGARRSRRRASRSLWTVTAVITVVCRAILEGPHRAGPALFFAVALVAAPAVFLAVGALASQLAATRRQAAAYAGAALGARYALRMVADSGTGLDVAPMGDAARLGRRAAAPHRRPPAGARSRSPRSLSRSAAWRCISLARRRPRRQHPPRPGQRRGSAPGCSSGRSGLAVRLMRPVAARLGGGDRRHGRCSSARSPSRAERS